MDFQLGRLKRWIPGVDEFEARLEKLTLPPVRLDPLVIAPFSGFLALRPAIESAALSGLAGLGLGLWLLYHMVVDVGEIMRG